MADKYGVSCGCTIETVPMEGMELMHRVVIIHCPLHANAEKMRDALLLASDFIGDVVQHCKDIRVPKELEAALQELD